jgi:transposase
MEVSHIMRAMDADVFDAVWAAVKALIPAPPRTHPLGCHRRRVPDEVCFRGILHRLVSGSSWTTIEAQLGWVVSDTTLRARFNEWVAAGVFDAIADEALRAYDRIVGLDLSEVAIDGSQHKAPCGGEGTGPNCTDKGRSGWKWSLATDAAGIPIGWVPAAANRHDAKLVAATLDDIDRRGLLADIETLHLDRGYDFAFVRQDCADRGLLDVQIPKCRKRKNKGRQKKKPIPLGLRWPVERTNSWFTNFGQLRRNTDRRIAHRHAELNLAIAVIITAKLIDRAHRWSPIR